MYVPSVYLAALEEITNPSPIVTRRKRAPLTDYDKKVIKQRKVKRKETKAARKRNRKK
ncbi:hypothetical protein [Bacillus sp. 1P06AnD]|uniref:hypothetical protein n=1 Tax=Bacillus sp. 1P06AnD TaxID=3132208 RepID=UPI0039A1E547